MRLLGTADAGRILIFRDDFSWHIEVFSLPARVDRGNTDHDFPRFTIDAGELADLDLGERYEISFAGVV